MSEIQMDREARAKEKAKEIKQSHHTYELSNRIARCLDIQNFSTICEIEKAILMYLIDNDIRFKKID